MGLDLTSMGSSAFNNNRYIVYLRYFKNSSDVVLACSIIDFNTPTLIGSCLCTVKRLPSECFSCI